MNNASITSGISNKDIIISMLSAAHVHTPKIIIAHTLCFRNTLSLLVFTITKSDVDQFLQRVSIALAMQSAVLAMIDSV